MAEAREATHLVHEDAPGNVAAHMEQSNGDAEAAIASAPHTLSLDLSIERSASTPLEGRGVAARWDLDSGRLQVWSSTQTPWFRPIFCAHFRPVETWAHAPCRRTTP